MLCWTCDALTGLLEKRSADKIVTMCVAQPRDGSPPSVAGIPSRPGARQLWLARTRIHRVDGEKGFIIIVIANDTPLLPR